MINELIEKAKKANEEEPPELNTNGKSEGRQTNGMRLKNFQKHRNTRSNLNTGIISNAVEQINKIKNISKESYLTECANANEENSNEIEKCNIFKVDHSKRGTAKCGLCKKPIVKDGLRIGKSIIFKSKHILRYFHVDCACCDCGVEMTTPIHRLPRLRIGERPLDIEGSCEYIE